MTGDNEFLNVFETADLLRVHDQTLRRLSRQKKAPAFKVGKEWRFRREALIKWADDQTHETESDGAIACSVLVIDDEELLCKALSGAVKRIGCKERRAARGPWS